MDALHIPETATETYLERLAENISRQIARSQNKKVRAQLDTMLEHVYTRLQEKRRESQQFPQGDDDDDFEVLELTDEFQEEGAAAGPEPQDDGVPDAEAPSDSGQPDVLLLTELLEEEEQLSAADADLSTQEHQVMKDRLRQVRQKIQERKKLTPEEDDGVVLADVLREVSEEDVIDSADFSSEQKDKVKNRLKGILEAVQAKKDHLAESAETGDLLQTLTRGYRGRVEVEGASAGGIEGEAAAWDAEKQPLTTIQQRFEPLSKDEQFIDICRKISQGQSFDLFQTMRLTEREQDILNAMASHLNSYKGLKKQQVFEMQHLTARSIHELDLIFKTYKIQGYLKAELTNVYNRLLNIRSRFSMLIN